MKVEMVEIGKLKALRGNRAINPKHVEKLKKAILKKNLLHLKPLIINNKSELLDGQHRLEAAKELGMLNVPCLCMEMKVDLEDVQAVNMNARGWTIIDYARSFAAQGSTEYARFLEFVEHTKIPVTTCIALLKHGGVTAGGRHLDNFRKGSFRVTSHKFARDFQAALELIEPEFKHCWKRSFLRAMLSVVKTKDVDLALLVEKLSRIRLKQRTSAQDYLEDLNECYNKQTPRAKRVTFKFNLAE